jgi:hypothetical protein
MYACMCHDTATAVFTSRALLATLRRELTNALETLVPGSTISQFVVKKNHETDTKQKLMSMLPVLVQTEVCEGEREGEREREKPERGGA